METCWQVSQSSSPFSAPKVVRWSRRWASKLALHQERWEGGALKGRWRRVWLRLRTFSDQGTVRSVFPLTGKDACKCKSFVIGFGAGSGEVERDVRVQAGRSKAKRKGAGGKIEKRVERKPVESLVKKKVVKPEMPDPGVRQPDDYYIYGPYGPYWWKAAVIGEPLEGTLSDKIYVSYTSKGCDKEYEEQARVDATINYDNKLKQLDEEVGLHYYWVFARSLRTSSVRLAPWEEWTLVAQVAVECATEPDKWTVGFRLDQAMRNVITQCIAWCRPDLTYVKKPKYQMRTENQLEFIRVLCDLVNPDSEEGSYFAKLCNMLAVDTNVTEEDAAAAYDKLSHEKRMKVLEHLLMSHPVELLYPFTRGRRRAEMREKQEAEYSAEFERWRNEEEDEEEDAEEEEVEEEDAEEEEIEDEEDEELSPWDEYRMFGGREGLKEEDFALDETEVIEGDNDDFEMEELVEGKTSLVGEECADNAVDPLLRSVQTRPTRLPDADDSGELYHEAFLKAAVRPFTYRNLVKEVVFMRRMQLEYPWRI